MGPKRLMLVRPQVRSIWSFLPPISHIEAQSVTGNITVLVPRGETYRVLTSSTTGTVSVAVDTDTASETLIDARSSTGNITVDYAD